MTGDTITSLAPQEPPAAGPRPAGRGGFAPVLRAHWTKFRTVRGWVVAVVVAAMVTVLLGVLAATGTSTSCGGGPVPAACPAIPVGPDGEAVADRMYFFHRPLAGDGAITVRVASMTGIITYPPPDHDKIISGLAPWAKAGIIIKDGIRPGSAYAALMVTGHHGVRMQHDFTHDTAGPAGGARWLRLTRTGDSITGDASADGTHWTRVGRARLSRLPATVQVGLFVTSPGDLTVGHAGLGGSIEQVRFTQATAAFDHVGLTGTAAGTAAWTGTDVEHDPVLTDWERYHRRNGVVESGGTYTVTGSGDVAPLGAEGGIRVESTLTGTVIGLMVLIVVAVMFVTAEYRRGLIRTTLLAAPRRGRVLAAMSTVIGSVAFTAGLAAAGVAVPLCTHILRANGNQVRPVAVLTELRIIAGTAALLAAASVLALALGALFRRAVPAVAAATVLVVVPYVLATSSVVPDGIARWLMRITPAAGFAIRQSVPPYAHVLGHYVPAAGYYPLPPWAGLTVLCGYAALALALAARRLRRSDA